MKIIVAGGRDFNNYYILEKVLNSFKELIDEVISGDARGVDELGARWATSNNIHVNHFPADWDYYGKAAGFIRNIEMADNADALIAFWDNKSKGTGHMIKTMQMKKKPYWVFNYTGEEIMKGG